MWTKQERMDAVLNGELADRPPVSAWRHFTECEHSTPKVFADMMIEFQNAYDWDYIKLQPRASYYAEAWGAEFDYNAYNGGVSAPCVKPAVSNADELDKIVELTGKEPVFQEQVEAVKQEECKDNLHIVVELYGNGHSSLVEIIGKHTNITRIEKDGECLEGNSFNTTSLGNSDDIELLNVKDILTFADTADLEDIRDTLERQLCLNSAISQEGMIGDFGANVGSTLLAKNARNVPSLRERAKASAASGSDARMSGCPLPVVINSGSGNQGITVTMPVLIYAEAYEIDHDRMLRALIISNLISIHQKRFIGDLSAYCGASSAACGAGAAIAWMLSNDSETKVYELVSNTITNTIATIGGMVCDGAKPSCAAKISVAVDAAITAWELSVKNLCFKPGEGLVKSDVEKTIRSIGRVAKNGMKATDTEIINIMLDE